MRRSWTSHGALNQSRSGVTASVMSRKRRPHWPSVSWIFSTGFAPRLVPPISNARQHQRSERQQAQEEQRRLDDPAHDVVT